MSRRPDNRDPASLRTATQAIHVGNTIDRGTGAIRTPLVMANAYALPEDPSGVDWSGTDELIYTRNSGANQLGLQARLAALEGGEDAVVLASGVAALHAVFFTFLRAGDHVVVANVTYEATWRLLCELLPDKYGITATFVDASDPEEIRAAIRPQTRLVHIETIGNPTTLVGDVAGAARVAHEAGILLSVDSTFTPAPLYRPLADGADLVVHSLTKYVNGHGDALGGAVIGRRDLVHRIKSEAMVDVGGTISPFNAWLITRGSVTLPLRLQRHLDSAQRVAEYLEGHDHVALVRYPGLDSHPQHDLAVRQFGGRGFGAVIAFALESGPTVHNRFVSNLRVITSAVSLGHDESLIVHTGTTGPRVATYPEPFRRLGHLRFSVGLEDPEDLVEDLEWAFRETFA